MKALALSFLMLLSASAFADSVATETVWFDGSSESDVVTLATEETRTEYRTVTVPSTCYRTEYRHQCHWSPGHCQQVCNPAGQCRRVCSPGRQICRNIPVRIPYSCQRQIRQAYEVFDYNVNTTVEFAYDLENLLNGAGEELTVKAVGKNVSVSLNDSKQYLVLKRKTDAASSRQGDLLTQTFSYKLSFVPAKIVQETLGSGVQNVSLNNGVLTFALGKHFNTEDFVQNLRIYEYRWLGRDTLLLDKNLSADQMSVSTDGELKVVQVDLNNLGINLPSRIRVIMTTSYDAKGAEIMNADSFELEASANWIFK